MHKTSSFGFGLVALLLAAPVSAHIDLISPPARLKGQDGNSQLKTKPCGQTTNKRTTDKVTTFAPGQKVDVKIKEYINHPGYFAVAFDPDGDDDFIFPRENPDKVVAASDDPKTLFPVDGMKVLGLRTDKDKDCYTEDASSHECTISITLPNMTCDNCTLQVTQFMYDKLGDNQDDEYYYQCADIKIVGSGTGGSGAGGGSGGAAAGGGGAGGAATTGGAAPTGGTTATGGGAPSGGGNAGSGSSPTSSAGSPTGSSGAPSGSGGAPSGSAGTTSTTGGSVANMTPAAEESSGCGVAHGATGAASALSALALLFAFGRRRRPSR